MTADPTDIRRRQVLRELRGDLSQQAFAEHLMTHGLWPITRQRLAKIESGVTILTPLHWEDMADALVRGGATLADVMVLRSGVLDIEPVPPSNAALRHDQWLRLAVNARDNRLLANPGAVFEKFYDVERSARFRLIAARTGIDPTAYRQAVQDRITKVDNEFYRRQPGDAVAVDVERSTLHVHVGRTDLFLGSAVLHNTGTVAWRDRLLYRVGVTVTSSLPFLLGVLLVPDTEPGQTCEITIPGRAQFFPNLAVVTYVMIFPDFTSCLPGHLRLTVDTRSAAYDKTYQLPGRFGRTGSS